MKLITICLAAVLVIPATGRAQSTRADSTIVPAPLRDAALETGLGLRDRVPSAQTGYLTFSLNPSTTWYAPPTRFDATLQSAATAATLGMFVGAIGNTLGWFDERTTWIMTGGLAAAGALYGGTTWQQEPTFRIRLGDDKP